MAFRSWSHPEVVPAPHMTGICSLRVRSEVRHHIGAFLRTGSRPSRSSATSVALPDEAPMSLSDIGRAPQGVQVHHVHRPLGSMPE